ncbi:MAG: response regulator [Lacunisphaera sp.]|nr:response regulator [Lacunisphaera sp.]
MSKIILHLDDEESIRHIVAEVLTSKGYRVLSARSPGEAVAAARAELLDLIISDLQLDEADGLKTVAQLLEIRPGTPVILLTGVLIDPRVARETVGKLVSAYLEKTKPLSAFLAEVTRLIGPGEPDKKAD